MPIKTISNPHGAFGQPLFAGAGGNDQVLIEVTNNTGMPVSQGMVMVWDTFAAVSTITDVLLNAATTITIASQTITANASTASYAATGLINMNNVVYAAAGASMPTALAGITAPMTLYYGAVTGSTFTGAQSAVASATNGAPASGTIFNAPQGGNFYSQAGLAAITTASDTGRLVTFSALTTLGALVAKDPLVAGVVSPTGDAATTGAYINPLEPMFLAIEGTARVYIGNATVAALANICTGAGVVGGADDATPTIGNMLGLSLEAQTAKDTNNTIRCKLNLG